jgi:branched-chain amino acid transport system ATP-binding protein
VRLAAQARLGGSMRPWQRVRPGDTAHEVALRSLERVGLAGRREALAGALSHGDKRKLELAILLATDPAVVLLDEPMAGVSIEDVGGLTEVIAGVHREEGKTVLMVEHHMDVLLGLADRVAVMHHGKLLALDTPAKVTSDPAVQQAYLGEEL